ncbi:hypothetical protein HanXRQr2_Chr09g0392351 [Helianthus annuus]|uniref:Uncharacterized protein n=1 Tax=Helianthus annuus TaxID=4232 RepID=A0A9K3I6Z3_HELAN|nr:hypothetical protein HanXRQr2_Chr09g0392351 [Helianthus annuus]KAJ0893501.1 hypothetical protein HanPSC8_Chr09g0378321 [Helianthus annuus]
MGDSCVRLSHYGSSVATQFHLGGLYTTQNFLNLGCDGRMQIRSSPHPETNYSSYRTMVRLSIELDRPSHLQQHP